MKKKLKKWRRINPYICEGCGKTRYSFIYDRAKGKICRLCARNKVPDNQPQLFNTDVDKVLMSGNDPRLSAGTRLNYVK